MEDDELETLPGVVPFQNISPQSLRRHSSTPRTPTGPHYTLSLAEEAASCRPTSAINNESEREYETEDELLAYDPAPSGRSSISSFPASVVHHDISHLESYLQGHHESPSRSRSGTPTSTHPIYKPLSPLPTQNHVSGFRNPSSVRALQMRDEFSDTEDLTPGHRRRGSRTSFIGYRSGSAYSTPGKRTSRSLQGSPVKSASKLRKEFPLVLLHCSLLPTLINPKAKGVSEELLEAIVPEPYKKRWKLLQEKVTKNAEVLERGVLIPHPKEDYDLLEERLLESIELETPRIRNGHYVPRSESRASVADSGFGSEENSSRGDVTDDEIEESKCADCGSKMCGERRWEVKIFAANGLMKAGAWSAAWSDMEKVDAQVSVWLPDDVRQEIESRLEAVMAQEIQMQDEANRNTQEEIVDARTREIYGEPKKQEEIDGLLDKPRLSRRPSRQPPQQTQDEEEFLVRTDHLAPPSVDSITPDVLVNYVRLLLQDGRNIAILLLSMLLVFYAVANQKTEPSDSTVAKNDAVKTQSAQMEILTTTYITTSTKTAVQTSTVIETELASLFASSSSTELVRSKPSTMIEEKVAESDTAIIPTPLTSNIGSRDDQSNVSETLSLNTAMCTYRDLFSLISPLETEERI